jgi:hypothetical protein
MVPKSVLHATAWQRQHGDTVFTLLLRHPIYKGFYSGVCTELDYKGAYLVLWCSSLVDKRCKTPKLPLPRWNFGVEAHIRLLVLYISCLHRLQLNSQQMEAMKVTLSQVR